MHTKNFKNENFKTEEKLANKLFGVSFAFCYGSSSRSEIRKAGHVQAIHLLALQINIFIFGVWPHGWLMLLSLISENWCDVKNGFENGEGGKSDTEKKGQWKIGQRCWISIINGSFHFLRQAKWVTGRKGSRTCPIGKIIVLESTQESSVRWSGEGQFFMNSSSHLIPGRR